MSNSSKDSQNAPRSAFAAVDEDALFRRMTVTSDEVSDPSFLAHEVQDGAFIRENFANAMSSLAGLPPTSNERQGTPAAAVQVEMPGPSIAQVREDDHLLKEFLLRGPLALHRATPTEPETSDR